MKNTDGGENTTGARSARAPPRSPWATTLLAFIGSWLLVPGVCTLVVNRDDIVRAFYPGNIVNGFVFVALIVTGIPMVIGIALLLSAWRRR